ncbi:hypothetical protein V1L52_10445 [Treponema sp. HNW]|uniref:hypothetical protein n=1 Tax=Treponema sp. HNW TaxID=3116654 RepID=UPI003D133911
MIRILIYWFMLIYLCSVFIAGALLRFEFRKKYAKEIGIKNFKKVTENDFEKYEQTKDLKSFLRRLKIFQFNYFIGWPLCAAFVSIDQFFFI